MYRFELSEAALDLAIRCHSFRQIPKELKPPWANSIRFASLYDFIEEIEFDFLRSVYNVSVFGNFICCREAVKRMKKNRNGCIVNITSQAAIFGGTRMTHYSSSKASINAFTIGLAREVAEFDIRVNAVSPGVIDTDANANASKERKGYLKNSVPLGRFGNSEEVAETVEWLLSDHSSYITGTVIPVAGGR